MAKEMPTKEVISGLLRYDAQTGHFYRKLNGRRADTRMTIGYMRVRITVAGVKHELLAHRLAFLMAYGDWPENEVDHINGDRSDNSISNLRHATRSQNAKNIKLRVDNSSGAFGISRHQRGWKVRIGKEYVGYYACFSRAIDARKAAEFENSYHANHGRAA